MNKEQRAASLRDMLTEHSHNYYVLCDPKITDLEYDELYAELVQLESENPTLITPLSPTQRIGTDPVSSLEKMDHLSPMMSIDNAFKEEDVIKWDARIKKELGVNEVTYVVEPKFDGASISLVYQDGVLINGVTRGDGTTGELVTHNVKTIKTIPLQLKGGPKGTIEIRGEILIQKEDFVALNRKREKMGDKLLANARNAAAGSLRQLDPKKAAARRMSIQCYGFGSHTPDNMKTQEEIIEHIYGFGFPSNTITALCKNITNAINLHHFIQEMRDDYPYEMDGVVIKVNDTKHWEKIGTTRRAPKWMLAYKFKAQEAKTVVEGITVQVGRLGALTPVAELKPVKVSGVTIKRATLHNEDEIKKKDIRIGDTVIVHRAGEVIPEIIRSLPELRTGSEKEYVMTQRCPVCFSGTLKEGSVVRCVSASCPAQLLGRLEHFVGREAFNIDGVGPNLLRDMVTCNLIAGISDIFFLTPSMLANLPGVRQKSVMKIKEAIYKAKEISFESFIYSLGIRHVGRGVSRLLADRYNTVTALTKATEEELLGIDGIGEEITLSIVAFLDDSSNLNIIDRMIVGAGINIQYPVKIAESTVLTGKALVFTGELDTMTRSEAQKLVRSMGGFARTSVSKKTDFVVGPGAGKKNARAVELGIPILTEIEFCSMIEE